MVTSACHRRKCPRTSQRKCHQRSLFDHTVSCPYLLKCAGKNSRARSRSDAGRKNRPSTASRQKIAQSRKPTDRAQNRARPNRKLFGTRTNQHAQDESKASACCLSVSVWKMHKKWIGYAQRGENYPFFCAKSGNRSLMVAQFRWFRTPAR